MTELSRLQIPHSLEAEQSVLGSLLIDARCAVEIMPTLGATDFFGDINRELYTIITDMLVQGETLDVVTVLNHLRQDGGHDEASSRAYVMQLMQTTPTAKNAAEYAAIVKAEAQRRELLTLLREAIDSIQSHAEAREVCGQLQGQIDALNAGERSDSLASSMDNMLGFLDYRDMVDSGKSGFVPTGYKSLDGMLGGGFVKEGLYILAARPGVGKTTFGLQIAERVAEKGTPVLFVSLEMSLDQLASKRLSVETGLASNKILLGDLADNYDAVNLAALRLSKRPLSFNRKPWATVADIGFLARQVKGCGLVVVDYLGLIRHETKGSLYERVTETSNTLKRLARSLGVPVLCLAQLNRENQQRADKKPQLSDLRDSGAIEQDADGVLLLHRLGTEQEDKTAPTALDCIVAKNRHGATGRANFNMYLGNGRIVPAYTRE